MEALASLYDTVFIVVDALDEYNGDLQEIVVEKFRALPFRDMRLFCTSRFLPRISDIFKDEMAIKITAQDQDIGVFVKGHIQQRTRLKDQVKKNPSLESDIISVVTSKASGMYVIRTPACISSAKSKFANRFLLAKFHMDSLTTKNNPADIRKALQELPPTLELTYQSTINRILSQARDDRDLALKVLAWVAFALRPLRMKEMQHAIATTRDSLVDGIRENELTDEGTILMVCVGLVELVPNADPDGDICLGFVHNTTQEYIKRKLTKNSPPKNSPHVEVGLAATCITYLLCDSFKTGISPTDEEFDARLRQNPLYAYAAQNWGHHARTAPTELGPLILEFLKSEAKVCASNQAMRVSRTFMGYDKRVPKQITAIHLVAYFGLADIMAALLKGGCDVNIPDSLGRTPLWWAAASGWDLMVMTLLAKKGVKVNCKDEFGQTPLLRAAQNGHDSVVNLLLSKEADVDSEDENKQTPLSWAAQKGHGAVIKLLLSKGANVNSRDVYGQTPLPWAAENGHEVAVKLLLASGADANSRDEEGRTPLWWAVENRHERVIKQLLAAGVDANPKDRLGQTPLSWAARKGRSAGVKLLLAAEGVDADSMDYFGQTPLSWAAQKGHDGVVKLLLERKEVDPASKDSWGRTPLSWATEYGHGEVARLLVGRTESDGI
jgi:ankyrin repeat protein